MLMFTIKFIKETERVQLAADEGYLEVPLYRIAQLPTTLRLKFETQKKISFRVLMTAINIWLVREPHKKERT